MWGYCGASSYKKKIRIYDFFRKPLILLVPGAGIEPARGLNLEGF